MVDPDHAALSITRQCGLLSIARSSFYYEGTGESPLNLRQAHSARARVGAYRRCCAVRKLTRNAPYPQTR